VAAFNKRLTKELVRFEREKTTDLKQALRTYAEIQRKYSDQKAKTIAKCLEDLGDLSQQHGAVQ